MLNLDDKPRQLLKRLSLGRFRYTENVIANEDVTVMINEDHFKPLRFADIPVFNYKIIVNNGTNQTTLVHGLFAYEHDTWVFYDSKVANSVLNQKMLNNAVIDNVKNAHYSMYASASKVINHGFAIINSVINHPNV